MKTRDNVVPAVISFSTVGACVSALLVGSLSCGGSPAGPGHEPTTITANNSTATPAPNPTATPKPCVVDGTCEAPTFNTNPPVRIHIRMYQVRKPNGDPAPCLDEEPAPGHPIDDPNTRYWFPVVMMGYTLKLDATAFDRFDKPTNSNCLNEKGDENPACITWRFGHGEHLIDNYSLPHLFQPTFRVAGAGDFQIQAEMYNDGARIRSPWWWMNFTDDPSESPCTR